MLSLILSGKNYKPLGAPPLVRNETPPMTREFSSADVSAMSGDVGLELMTYFRVQAQRKAPNF